MQLTLLYLVTSFNQCSTGFRPGLGDGQIFTNGLAIIDSPAPGSPLHAGSTAAIAIDISGDGHLTQDAVKPNSGLSTRFDSLEIYLTSPDINVTVSQGPGLLMQESGSTVKHISWMIDNCIPAANYNLTFYEGSHIQDQAYFTITPLPVSIQNVNPSGQCQNGTNAAQSLPQTSSSLSQSLWLDSTQTSMVPFPSSTSSGLSLHIVNTVFEAVMLGASVAYLMCWV